MSLTEATKRRKAKKKAKRPQKPWLVRSVMNASAHDPEKPEKPTPAETSARLGIPRLLNRRDIVALTGLSYVTLWQMGRCDPPKFPPGRIVGGKTCWISSEVLSWLENLPIRKLKAKETNKG